MTIIVMMLTTTTTTRTRTMMILTRMMMMTIMILRCYPNAESFLSFKFLSVLNGDINYLPDRSI